MEGFGKRSRSLCIPVSPAQLYTNKNFNDVSYLISLVDITTNEEENVY